MTKYIDYIMMKSRKVMVKWTYHGFNDQKGAPMRKISERGLFGVLVMIISMLAVQMSAFASNTYENSTQIKSSASVRCRGWGSFKSVFPEQSGKFLREYSSGWLDERGTAAANSST